MLSAAYTRPPTILAVAGDETQHLLWRLQTELSPALCHDPDLEISLLIGTNNIGNSGHSAEETAEGALTVARVLLARTRARLLLHAILPRGENPAVRAARLAARARSPFISLMPKVRRANAIIFERAQSELARDFPGRLRTVECGPRFLPTSHAKPSHAEQDPIAKPSHVVNLRLMSDALHPTVEGARLLAECVRDALAQWPRGRSEH